MRWSLPLILGVSMAGGCSKPADDGSRSKLANELVACKNEQASLREQLAEAKALLKKAEAAASAVVKLDPIELKANGGQPGSAPHREGNIPPEAVVRVVQQNSSGLKVCYNRALKRKPDLQYVSALTARFAVKNSGNAVNVSFVPHTDAEMERCMASTMGKWKFPSFQGDPVAFEAPVSLVAR